MSNAKIGECLWQELTVTGADDIADFYHQVIGWQKKPVAMSGYDDHGMMVDGAMKAGICHAKGDNASMPPQWLMYVAVANLQDSMNKVLALGGKVLVEPRAMGKDRFTVIEDPAGAVLALYQQAES